MQSVSSRIWTRVAVSIFCDDNHYTTSPSLWVYPYFSSSVQHLLLIERIVLEVGGRWSYICYFISCCCQDFLKTARRILVRLDVKLFLNTLCQSPYCSMGPTASWKKIRFIFSDWSDRHMTDSLSFAVRAVCSHVLMFSVDGTLLSSYVIVSSSFR